MSSERTVAITAPASGRKNFVALDVSVKKLAVYSSVAKHHYFPGADSKDAVGKAEKRNLKNRSEFDLGEGMYEGYARTIATFIKNSDPANPAPLTLDLFAKGKDLCVEELIKVFRVIGYGYKVPREMYDEAIRDALRDKMYKIRPYTSAQFKLIAENVDFDRGLISSAFDRVVWLHINKYFDRKTEVEVEQYCKARYGYWDCLLDEVPRVLEKMRVDELKKQERKEVQAKRRSMENANAASEVHVKVAKEDNQEKAGKGKGKGNRHDHNPDCQS